ncbi:MAG: SOS response-associated peptidase [Pseudomonadota bacterium]
MCGRFNITSDPLTVLLMELVGLPHPGPDNFNTAPTETVPVLRLDDAGEPEIAPMRWWLTPYWSKGPSTKYAMFNAKSETAAKSPAFREPFRKRRCVVPVSGFYEWTRQNNQKLPYYLTPQTESGLLLAGLWDRWRDGDSGESLESFTVLTVDAADEMAFVHKRQPLMLSVDDARRWMDPANEDFEALIGSELPVALAAVPVSTYVNNARNKDSRCVDPIGTPIPLSTEAPDSTEAAPGETP